MSQVLSEYIEPLAEIIVLCSDSSIMSVSNNGGWTIPDMTDDDEDDF